MKFTKIWDVRRRCVTAIVISIVAALLIAFSPYPWVGLLATCTIATVVGIGLWEYVKLAEAKNFHPNARLMIIVGVIEVFAFYFAHKHAAFPNLPVVILFIAMVTFYLAHFSHTYKALAQIAIE